MNREDEYYDVLGQKQLAALKREMLPCFESAAVRATHKVMAELEQENSVTDHELRDCPRCGHCCTQWVGLTEDEIALIVGECAASHRHDDVSFAREIEAKLREKNGG